MDISLITGLIVRYPGLSRQYQLNAVAGRLASEDALARQATHLPEQWSSQDLILAALMRGGGARV
jgi:hypothetical protein